jgi:hypothetical protein
MVKRVSNELDFSGSVRYVTAMALSNAERQARFRNRLKAKAQSGVTPEEVREAVRVQYELQAAEPTLGLGPFDEWAEKCRSRKGRGQWQTMVPESDDPSDYMEDAVGAGATPEQAALLARVGAVWLAMTKPPKA